MTTVWLVAVLSLTLPNTYQLRSNTTQSFPLPGPPGMTTKEEFRSWVGPGGRQLTVFYWTPYPRDLGPMDVVAKFRARVAGKDTEIIETKMFMGRAQKVLVTHLGFPELKGAAMIYASGMDREEFTTLLAGISQAPRR